MKKNDELDALIRRDAEYLRSLSFSETYIREAAENTHKWGATGLLAGISDPYIARQMGRLLENQRLKNESDDKPHIPVRAETVCDPETWVTQWKRCSIPAVRRVFADFLPHELVSVQAMNAPQASFHYVGLDERTHAGTMVAVSRNMGRYFWRGGLVEQQDTGLIDDKKKSSQLDFEVDAVSELSERYKTEVGREIVRDLTNNAGSRAVVEYSNTETLLSMLDGMSGYIAAKLKGRDATWAVTGTKLANLLRPHIAEWQDADTKPERLSNYSSPHRPIVYRGVLNGKYRLYEDPFYTDSVLMGHKDSKNHYFSGYFYSPFQPFAPQPDWWYADKTEHGHNFLMARYGKKLINADFYGFVKVNGVPEQVVEGEKEPTEQPGNEVAESEE